MFIIYIILFFVVLLCVIHIVFNCNEKARMMRKIPGPRDDFILGNALAIMVSPVEIMKAGRVFAKNWKGIYRLYMYPMPSVNIFNPEDIEVIVSNMKHSDKSALYSLLKPWLGDGLLLSKGQKWQQRRKILTPTFHFNILRQFFEIFKENGQRLVMRLETITGKPVDIVPILTEFTLHTICESLPMFTETAMGTKLNDERTGDGKFYKEAILDLGHVILRRGTNLLLYADCIFKFSSLGRKQAKYLKVVHSFTRKVIKDRTEYIEKNGVNFGHQSKGDDTHMYKKKKAAMLDLLITASKEGLIDHEGIQEEVDTFMSEGHDTTASGLTFCFMLLANHKNIQNKILAELNDIFGDSKRPINMNDITRMKYLDCCIKESLRLYPPVHFISRNLNEPVKLSNYEVPAGILCHIQIYDLHRRADLYENPHDFVPERFLPENSVDRHPYAYIPFSAGPRNCIGQKFALMEMKLVIAAVLREFTLEPVTRPSDIQFVGDLILRNNGPVEVTFVKRGENI